MHSLTTASASLRHSRPRFVCSSAARCVLPLGFRRYSIGFPVWSESHFAIIPRVFPGNIDHGLTPSAPSLIVRKQLSSCQSKSIVLVKSNLVLTKSQMVLMSTSCTGRLVLVAAGHDQSPMLNSRPSTVNHFRLKVNLGEKRGLALEQSVASIDKLCCHAFDDHDKDQRKRPSQRQGLMHMRDHSRQDKL